MDIVMAVEEMEGANGEEKLFYRGDSRNTLLYKEMNYGDIKVITDGDCNIVSDMYLGYEDIVGDWERLSKSGWIDAGNVKPEDMR